MFSAKRFGIGCLAAVLVSSGVRAASSSGVQVSGAYCRVTASSTGSASSESAYVEAWESISQAVCNASGPVDVSVQAHDIAFAIATAFAEVVADCKTYGDAEARADAYAYAEKRAEAIGSGIAAIWAGVSCGECQAAVDAYSQVSEWLVAEAVAEAWTDIYVFSDKGGDAAELSVVTSDIVVERISDIIIDISGTMHAAVQDSCAIDLINSVTVGNYFSYCALYAASDAYTIEVDAIAQAGAEASAWACNGDLAEAHVQTVARATAKAVAEAIASANVWCETNGGDTLACGMAQTDIETVAYAQADAFAVAFAEAESCNCHVAAGAEVGVWGEIFAVAAVNAYADTCASGGSFADASDFQAELDERLIAITAEAIATAVADGGDQCRVSLDVCSAANGSCVRNFGQCYGEGFEHVKPCCDDRKCVKVSDNIGYKCSSYVSRSWDGDIATCVSP